MSGRQVQQQIAAQWCPVCIIIQRNTHPSWQHTRCSQSSNLPLSSLCRATERTGSALMYVGKHIGLSGPSSKNPTKTSRGLDTENAIRHAHVVLVLAASTDVVLVLAASTENLHLKTKYAKPSPDRLPPACTPCACCSQWHPAAACPRSEALEGERVSEQHDNKTGRHNVAQGLC